MQEFTHSRCNSRQYSFLLYHWRNYQGQDSQRVPPFTNHFVLKLCQKGFFYFACIVGYH